MDKNIHVVFDKEGSPYVEMFGMIMENIDGCEIRRTGDNVTVSFSFSAKNPPKVGYELKGHSFALENPRR